MGPPCKNLLQNIEKPIYMKNKGLGILASAPVSHVGERRGALVARVNAYLNKFANKRQSASKCGQRPYGANYIPSRAASALIISLCDEKTREEQRGKENSPSRLAMEKRKLSILGAEQSGVAVRLRGTTAVVTGTLSRPCANTREQLR
jgi:hypothetical protein